MKQKNNNSEKEKLNKKDTMRNEKKNIKGLIAFIIVIIGVWLFGFATLPDNLNITVDTGENYNDVISRLETISNKTHKNYINTSISPETYEYLYNSHKELYKLSAQPKTVVQSFCKEPDRIGKLIQNESKNFTSLELNEPVMIEGYMFEIVGAQVYPQKILLDINGSRYNLVEGDSFVSIGEDQRFIVDKIFTTEIPILWAGANIRVEVKLEESE